MRTARVETGDGVVEGEYTGDSVVAGDEYTLDDYELVPPCEPSTVYCVGRNYAETLEQMEYERPDEPDFFIKPAVSVHPPDTPVTYPSFTDELTYAGELAAVVGETCKDVPRERVPDVVEGYTVMNDLDALDQPGRTARKAFDSSAPLGPCVADVDPTELGMRTTINGETRQEANTRLMLFDAYDVVSFLSERFTLREGDVVAFGSPANPGTVEPGDEIEIWYEGVGTLRNTVQ